MNKTVNITIPEQVFTLLYEMYKKENSKFEFHEWLEIKLLAGLVIMFPILQLKLNSDSYVEYDGNLEPVETRIISLSTDFKGE